MKDYKKIFEEQVRPIQVKENTVTTYMRNIEFLAEWNEHFRQLN